MSVSPTWLSPSSRHHHGDLRAGAVGADGVEERAGDVCLGSHQPTTGPRLRVDGATGANRAESAGVLVDLSHGLGQRSPYCRTIAGQ